jgi:hypothetical protein
LPTRHELGDAYRCVRLTKFAATRKEGEPDHYDVVLNPGGAFSAGECLGFLRHGHCKHTDSLLAVHAAGKLEANS